MGRKILLITIDGGDPEYFKKSDIPHIRALAKEGFYVEGHSIIPSVTNVNNVSIITGTYPKYHGITANYWYNPKTGEGTYMESPEFVLQETIFKRAKKIGMSTALLTAKEKLKRMLEKGAEISISAEDPPQELISKVGPVGNIYSAEIDLWIFRALKVIIQERDPDLIYVSTTDYVMHKFTAEEEKSLFHMHKIDEIIGQIMNENPEREVYITADHGMSSKERVINLKEILKVEGIEAEFVPIIKDRYIIHHDNLGGSAYLYLKEQGKIERAVSILENTPGIEEVYLRYEAVEKFNLMSERIGDIFVLGSKEVVFGEMGSLIKEIKLRSHGSRYESNVPIIGYGGKVPKENYKENIDIVRNLHLNGFIFKCPNL